MVAVQLQVCHFQGYRLGHPQAGAPLRQHDQPGLAPTYTIRASNGIASTFELVERDGEMMLVLFVDETVFVAPEDDE